MLDDKQTSLIWTIDSIIISFMQHYHAFQYAHFKKEVQFDHNVNVNGVVTMQGKNVGQMFERMEAMTRENAAMRQSTR